MAMTAQEFQRLYGGGRTPGFVAESDAATAKAARKATKASPANALTKAIITLLKLEGCTVWRQNNGAVYDATFGGYRAGSATPGIADILGYHRATGRFVAVEVKAGSDRLSPEQTRFLEEVTAAGGFACEGRELLQVRNAFRAWLAALLL